MIVPGRTSRPTIAPVSPVLPVALRPGAGALLLPLVYRRLVCAGVLGAALGSLCRGPSHGQELQDPPAPIEEKAPRTEQTQSHLEALSLFGAGRIEEQNDRLAEALRLYQRALRYEPNALPIVREIVPLAFSLERPNEAIRYALKAAELDPSDPLLLRQLGLHLAETGRFRQAQKLYEQAREQLRDNPRSAAYILLSIEFGRLCFVTDHVQEAADAFAIALPAIDKPEDFGFTDAQKQLLVGKEAVRNLELFAEAFLAADRPDDAQAVYERLERLRPDKALRIPPGPRQRREERLRCRAGNSRSISMPTARRRTPAPTSCWSRC